jgi:hypothetical protein
MGGGREAIECTKDVERMAKNGILTLGDFCMLREKRTMTLNLTDAEMRVLEQLSREKDLSKTAVIRQALRLYQLVDARLSAGGKLFFEDEQKQEKAELMVL